MELNFLQGMGVTRLTRKLLAAMGTPPVGSIDLYADDATGHIVQRNSSGAVLDLAAVVTENIVGSSADAYKAIVQPGDYPLLPAGRRVGYAKPVGGTTTFNVLGTIAPVATGTATAANNSSTSRYNRMDTIEALITAASTTAVAGYRFATSVNHVRLFTGSGTADGGFFVRLIGGPATGVATASSRFTMALTTATGAPTDVNPSTIANQISAGYDDTDTNIQIMLAGASGTVKVDTGIAVPTTDRAAMYELLVYVPPGATPKAYVTFTDLINDVSFGHTETNASNLPAANTGLSARIWSSAGGTSSVIGVSVHDYYETTNF